MPIKDRNLYGMVADHCPVALIMLDVINDLEFEGGELLVNYAVPMAHRLAELKKRAKALGIPVIYVNDNYGRWQSEFSKLYEHCVADDVRGKPIVELLKPDKDDYFVLKPKHSGFFSTTLDVLLDYIGVKTIILTGVAANICVLFTANDAYMRDFNLYVPSDCTASNDPRDNQYALKQMEAALKADITQSQELDLKRILHEANQQEQPLPADVTRQFAKHANSTH